MSMPIDLVLVRHGESEGNVANKQSRKGDDAIFTPEFRQRPGFHWRLTEKGRNQAAKAGEWIRDHFFSTYDRYYVSDYLRAKETAALLSLPQATWNCDFYLREREWGDMDVLPEAERQARFAESLKKREIDGFFWTPPNGESLAQLCLRIDRILQTWHRECFDKRVIAVCHGEVMWAFRVRLERMSQQRFRELDVSKHPHNQIHNCQILHYTRLDPIKGTITPYYMWVRSVCPTDTKLSSNAWQPIVREKFTNEQLLEQVGQVPSLVT